MSRRNRLMNSVFLLLLALGLLAAGPTMVLATSETAPVDKTAEEVVEDAYAHEAADEHHGGVGEEKFMDFVWRSMNFVVFITVLFILLRKPVGSFFSSRREDIAHTLEDLEKKKSEAEVRFKELELKLADMADEREKILADYIRDGEEEREKIIANAKEMAERIKKQAEVTIDQEIKAAKADLVAEIANMSANMAEDLIKSNINDEDQARLVEESLKTI